MATTKREIHSMNYASSGIIIGQKIDHFTLSVQNPFVQDKGSLAALNLLYWDRSFLDFNSKSFLYIIIPKNLMQT